MEPLVAWFKDLPPHSVAIAGGKGASLSDISRAGLPVPSGFVVCAPAFQIFLAENDGLNTIHRLADNLNVHDEGALNRAAVLLHDLILSNPLPGRLAKAILNAYQQLGEGTAVAVRSSAVSEDGDAASFAGQQATFLNVGRSDMVLRDVQACWASFFSARALFYRAQKGSLADTAMAVVVQTLVNSDKSGVLFTLDPVNNRRDHMMVEAVFGLGEGMVSGRITPDNYVVDRDDGSLVREYIATQQIAVVRAEHGGTQEVQLSEVKGNARVLTDDDLERLRKAGLELERYFGKPQDVEWCIQGDALYLLQSRPITTL